jgi:hypothetical protein
LPRRSTELFSASRTVTLKLNGVEEKRRSPRPSTKEQRAATVGRRLQETVSLYTVIDQAIGVVIEVSSMP